MFRFPVANPIVTAGWFYNDGKYHGAVDFRAAVGTPVYAAEDGVVNWVQTWNGYSKTGDQSYGNLVRIRHDDYNNKMLESYYGHLSKICVHNAQFVHEGDIIGYSGATGKCEGAHLHFEVRLGRVRLNPLNWLSSEFKRASNSVNLGVYTSVEVPSEETHYIIVGGMSTGDFLKVVGLADSLGIVWREVKNNE